MWATGLGGGFRKRKPCWASRSTGTEFGEAFRQRDYSYSEIVASYPGAEKSDEVGKTIWYNGLATIKAKTQYVVVQGLAGMMIWSLDYDVPGDRSLLSAMDTTLQPGRKAETSPAPTRTAP